ncbi:MAG: type IV pili methyl-accepting chemotaxis transducer N-terminal domain-containing protein [Aliarcobacter sp.]|nr:type IV pili methyl-accepting chemotaxis transducer N-terminal domain-containing protein [Aliarcobacter sp.]
MKQNTISTKIRFIGILFIVLMTSIIVTTIYLNEKNKKDALIINIAGKQRMLTQNISKNIFYLYHNSNSSYSELDSSTIEFIYNLNSLKDGNTLTEISKAPTDEIAKQLSKVEVLWNDFHKNINEFKKLAQNKDNDGNLKDIVNYIYNTNTILLKEVDALVSMYTTHTEQKSDYLRYIQYIFALIIIFLIIYSFLQLKSMEENAKKFLEESKKIMENDNNELLVPIKIEAEKEIVEATDTINCFIDKINSAMTYSANAIEQSKNASIKLEEITDEFDKVIDELTNSADISKQLYKSEDIVIQSQENLMNSTKKLQELKNELDKLLNSCKAK